MRTIHVVFLSVLLASSALTPRLSAQGLGLPPVPPGNPQSPEKIQLGKALFWEEQLASTRSIACGSCHLPEAGGIDARTATQTAASTHPGPDGVFGTGDDVRASAGVPRTDPLGAYQLDAVFGLRPQVTPRRAPTMINAAFAPHLFWDGRAAGTFLDPVSGTVVLPSGAALETLVAAPPVNSVEMGHLGRDWNDVVARIESIRPLALSPNVPAPLASWIAGRTYPALYTEVFGAGGVTAARTCMAIASYVRSLVSNQTPFDQFLAGNTSALTPQQQEGQLVFEVGRCIECHVGANLTAHEFKYTGVRPRADDLGRFLVTGVNADRGRMKVPDLRNIALRAPYFHTGGKPSLDAVISFYSAGGDFEVGSNDQIAAPIVGPLRVSLIDFLQNGLLDPRVAQGLAPFDHPALSAGTARVPQPYGTGTPGSAGLAPTIHAVEPSLLATADFSVAISGARAGGNAGLYVSLGQDLGGTPFQGATLHVVRGAGTRLMGVGPLAGTGPTGGFGSISFHLPRAPAFVGTRLYAQWLVVDPHAGGNCSATRAIEILIF